MEHLNIQTGEQGAADACAAWILDALRETLENAPRASIAISGGSTPALMFDTLARAAFDWTKVHIFWVDERCVPPLDAQSNFRLADQHWLTPARVSKYNVHRIHGEMPPAEGAAQYIEEIREHFYLAEDELPVFDLLHRGIGPDAHTASLFPGEPLIADRTGIAAPVWVEKLQSHRVTLLPGVLLAARRTVILAAGAEKAEPLYNVLRGAEDAFRFPCQLATRGAPNAWWFLDTAAAARLG